MGNKMTIKGIKKAVGDFKKFNAGGMYDPEYGVLMYDKDNGEVWTDYFYSLGHNSYKVYHSKSIVNLGNLMSECGLDITIDNVKTFINKTFVEN